MPNEFHPLSRHRVSPLLLGISCNLTCVFLVPPHDGIFKVMFNYFTLPTIRRVAGFLCVL